MKNCVIYITDDVYLLYCLNSIKSLLKIYNNIPIYILHTGLELFKKYIKNDIFNLKNIFFINCSNLYSKYIDKNIIKKKSISQLKWIIPKLDFFYNYDNVLYVDSDTEFDGNIDDLFNYNTSKQIVGIDDVVNHNNNINEYRIVYKYKYKLSNYINSGVLVYKTKKFNDKIHDKIYHNIIDKYNRMDLFLKDQDMINICFDIECLYDYRYNYSNLPQAKNPSIKDIKIYHYIDKNELLLKIFNNSFFPL